MFFKKKKYEIIFNIFQKAIFGAKIQNSKKIKITGAKIQKTKWAPKFKKRKIEFFCKHQNWR